MHVQIVMNHSGDSRHVFDLANPTDVEVARVRFDDLVRRGYSPVGFAAGDDKGRLLRSFDSSVERTIFIPQLRGG